jgi:hypothetical protein
MEVTASRITHDNHKHRFSSVKISTHPDPEINEISIKLSGRWIRMISFGSGRRETYTAYLKYKYVPCSMTKNNEIDRT